jgi:hypothetical protein
MRPTPSTAAWLAAAIVIALGAFLVGRGLRSEPASVAALDLDAPSYTAPDQGAGRSRGGFTGFADAGGLDGRTVLTGRVSRVTSTELVIETATGTSNVRLTSAQSLRRIEAGTAASIRAGATVAVVRNASDEVVGVLVLSEP